MTEMTAARDEIDDLAEEFAPAGAMKGMIFGHHGLKTAARKMFCFEHQGSLVFKLDGEARAGALRLPGAGPFAPMPDRPAMGNWVVVPVQHASDWAQLARTAFAHVSGGSAG